MSFIGGIVRYFVERGAKNKGYAQLIHRLETDREAVVARRARYAQGTECGRACQMIWQLASTRDVPVLC